MGPYEIRERAGELVREVDAPEFVRKFRREEWASESHLKTLGDLLRQASLDASELKERNWNEAAKFFGYNTLDELHAAGFSLAANFARGALELRETPRPKD